MKSKKLKKKIIRDFKFGKYRELKGNNKYFQGMASHTKDRRLTSITLDEGTILKLKGLKEDEAKSKAKV